MGGKHEQPEDKSAMDKIKAIEVFAGDWPDQALQQMTTLDHSQLQALKVVSVSCFQHAWRPVSSFTSAGLSAYMM